MQGWLATQMLSDQLRLAPALTEPAPSRETRLTPGWLANPELTPDERAHGLLESHLIPEQFMDFRVNHAFNVRGSNGKLYRILDKTHHNVLRGTVCWCGGPMYAGVPRADFLLAVKLVIEGDWPTFNRVAYTSGHMFTPVSSYGGRI